MLTQTSTEPSHVSEEEHTRITACTPASFADIPPILRWGDIAEIEVGGEGWWDGKMTGKLWVTEEAVAFLPTSGQPGFSLTYQSLTLHALTSASEAGPAHLYCQIDDQVPSPAGGDDDDDGDDGEDTEMREIRIYVEESKLQSLFNALSFCSALHDSLLPNGQTSTFPFFDNDDDDEGEDGAWEDADEDGDAKMNGANGSNGDAGGEAGRIRSDFHSGGGPAARFRPY